MNTQKKKKLFIGGGIALLALACIIGFYLYQGDKEQKILESLKVEFKNKDTIIEYGSSDEKLKDYFTFSADNIKITANTKKVGKQEIKIKLCKGSQCKVFEKNIVVKDTQKPVIKLKEKIVNVEYGATYDPHDNIKSVNDPIDGKIEYSIDDVDTSKPGEQKIKVSTTDKNGLEATATFTVIVGEPEKEKGNNETPYNNNGNTNESGGTSTSNPSNQQNNTAPAPENNANPTPQPPVEKPYVTSPIGIMTWWLSDGYTIDSANNACKVYRTENFSGKDGTYFCSPVQMSDLSIAGYTLLSFN